MNDQLKCPLRAPLQRRIAGRLAICHLALTALLTPVVATAAPEFEILRHALHRPGPIGVQGWGVVDVDGDGREDVVTSSDGPAAMLLVYGRRGDDLLPVLKQDMVFPPDSIAAVTVIPGGGLSVAMVGTNRSVTLFGGWPLSPIADFAVDFDVHLAHAADFDGDGLIELLCAGLDRISVYSLPGGEHEWSMQKTVHDVAAFQFDADPALELVLPGSDSDASLVLDGATRMAEWTYPAAFGRYVAAGRLGQAAQPGFVAAQDWSETFGFSAAPYGLAWSASNVDTDGVAVGDIDANGQDEYAIGDGQWGDIRVYASPSRQLLHTIPTDGHGLWALDFVDLDGDATDEVFFSARTENSTDYFENFGAELSVVSGGPPRLTIPNYQHGVSAAGLFDLDLDGTAELIRGASHHIANLGFLKVEHVLSGSLVWSAPYEIDNLNAPFQTNYQSIHAAQLDAGGALELIAVGTGWQGSRALVLDGSDFSLWAALELNAPHFAYGNVVASRLVDHDGSGPLELLVLSEQYHGPGYAISVDAFGLPNGEWRWGYRHPGDQSARTAYTLDAGQLDADASPEYVVAHSEGVNVYDADGATVAWSLARPTRGAMISPDPDARELLVWSEEGDVDVHDGVTGNLLRSFSLGGPIEAIDRLPGSAEHLLAIRNERVILATLEGDVLAESGWIGSAPGKGNHVAVAATSEGWAVSVGRSFTTYLLSLSLGDPIFADGFEVPEP